MNYYLLADKSLVKVDADIYKSLKRYRWRIHWNGYPVRYTGDKVVFMHRVVNDTPEGKQTDHINRNKLDNRRINLRTVTNSENRLNTGIPKNNTSGYKGVRWHKIAKKWVAGTKLNGRYVYLGLHDTAQKAHKAYLTYTASR